MEPNKKKLFHFPRKAIFSSFLTDFLNKQKKNCKKKTLLTIRQRYLEFHMRRSKKHCNYGSLYEQKIKITFYALKEPKIFQQNQKT